MIDSEAIFVPLVCGITRDRRELPESPAADLLGIYTGDGLVRTDVYERDIVVVEGDERVAVMIVEYGR